MRNRPLGLFITWTVYGTFLPGDSRGLRQPNKGIQLHNSKLEQGHVHRLNHPIKTLSPDGNRTHNRPDALRRCGSLEFCRRFEQLSTLPLAE